VAYIVKITGRDRRQVRYWTEGDGGCTTVEVLKREPVWAGSGLEHVGLVAGARADPEMTVRLLDGLHPLTGQVLRVPKLEAHPDAKLDGTVFARALRALAAERGAEPVQLLRSARSRQRWGRLERAMTRSRKPDPMIPYTDLHRLAKDLGLRLESLYDPAVLAFARKNRKARRAAGVKAFGLTVTWPKSISALAALAPPRIAQIISEEVMATLVETVAVAEYFAGYALRGHQGDGKLARHMPGQGLIAVILPHFQARRTKGDQPGDPHLHTHITFPTLTWAGGKWGAFGAGGHELYRHIAVLGEFAKARLRQRLHARLGTVFAYDRTTGEWEAAAVPALLRRTWSRRRVEILEAAPGASAAKRRVVAARLVKRERGRRWEGVLLLDRWRREADDAVGDVDAMLAAAFPGPAAPGAQAPVPDVGEVLGRLRLPRRAAVRHKGAERREILAAVIATYPNSLHSLGQALEMTDQVMAVGGFTLLPWTSRMGHIDPERYRVPPGLVAASRQPVGWPGSRKTVPIPDRAPAATVKPDPVDQAQQLLALTVPAPGSAARRPRRTAPRPAAAADRTDQVELDLGLDQGTDQPPVTSATDSGQDGPEQLTIELPPRPHRQTLDQDLADQLAAAQADLDAAEAEAVAHDLEAVALLAAARAGQGGRRTGLHKRRLLLEAVAALGRAHTRMLAQAQRDRDAAADDLRRAARLRELAEDRAKGRFGREKKNFTDDQRTEALGLITDPGQAPVDVDGGGTRMGRADALRHAERLETRAKTRTDAAEAIKRKAQALYDSAATQAAPQDATVERAVLEDDWTPEHKNAEAAAAVADDVERVERERDQVSARDRAAIETARAAVDALRTEMELRARMPASQRATEDAVRVHVAAQARAAERADQAKRAQDRAARQAVQQRQIQQGRGGAGGVR